jgi:hypothetical protein
MEISIMRAVGLEDLKDKDPEAALEELKGKVIADIEDKYRILKGDLEDPTSKAVVCVHTKYLSDGIKNEPTDDQRSQLSALTKVHKIIMDKVKGGGNSFEDVLYYGKLAGMVVNLMKEIENG